MSENTSSRLLKRYLAGSESAAFVIHERYQTRLIGLARKQLTGVLKSKIDPEDISQETFQAFFNLADGDNVQWKNRGDLWRLLAGIAINKVKQNFDHYSAAKRDTKIEVQLDAQDVSTIVPQAATTTELTELVAHLLTTEKPLTKSVVEFRLAGFTHKQIAEKVGRSTRTIRRVIESLQARLIREHDLGLNAYFETESLPRHESSQPPQAFCYEDFQLLRMVGQGSFAKVYLAKQVETQRLFAIKAIKKHWLLNPAVRQTFRDEAQLLQQLNHPNIVAYHGVGELPNGGIFLLLEYIEGVPLINAIPNATAHCIKSWKQQLASAVAAIHSAGIVHGDLSMNNILVDLENQIRVIDFGLGILSGDFSQATKSSDIQSFDKIIKLLGDESKS